MLRLYSTFVIACALSPSAAWASYAFYVGGDLTADGEVLIGGTGEEVSSHWLEIVPRRQHAPDATMTVGVTEEANIPGERIEIPQARETARYMAMFYTEFRGFPPPLVNGGLNEHGVAVRDVWSPSRQELVDMTATPQRGLSYSDLAQIVLERATSAREGAELIGELIAEHGFATYGGNSHLIADESEGWIVIQFAGGEGLWVAERLGPNDIRVSFPGYMGEIPDDYDSDTDYMGSPNLIEFAIEQGWYDPDAGEPFNVHDVYGNQDVEKGDSGYKYVDSMALEDELRELAPDIRTQDLMAYVRDPRIAHEEAGYGQVAALSGDVPADLELLWVAPTGSVTAPFIPYWIGTQEVPPEYGKHRYLTKDAARTFLAPDYQAQEGTEFAGRLFKRLMYHTCERPERFLPEVVEALEAFEARQLAEAPRLEAKALALMDAGQGDLARDVLSRYSVTQSMAALRLGRALLSSIEARTKVLYGIREPESGRINEPPVAGRDTISCVTSVDRAEPVIEPDDEPSRPLEIDAAPAPAEIEALAAPAQATVESEASGGWAGLGIAFALGASLGGVLVLSRRRARG